MEITIKANNEKDLLAILKKTVEEYEGKVEVKSALDNVKKYKLDDTIPTGFYIQLPTGELVSDQDVSAEDLESIKDQISNIAMVQNGYRLLIAKQDLGEFNFEDAQTKVKEVNMTNPSTHEAHEIGLANRQGLGEVFEKVGGQPMQYWYWTRNAIDDKVSSGARAWYFYPNGYLYDGYRIYAFSVRPVLAF